jgi:hypothetical protein
MVLVRGTGEASKYGISHVIHALLVSFDERKDVERRKKNVKLPLGG